MTEQLNRKKKTQKTKHSHVSISRTWYETKLVKLMEEQHPECKLGKTPEFHEISKSCLQQWKQENKCLKCYRRGPTVYIYIRTKKI